MRRERETRKGERDWQRTERKGAEEGAEPRGPRVTETGCKTRKEAQRPARERLGNCRESACGEPSERPRNKRKGRERQILPETGRCVGERARGMEAERPGRSEGAVQGRQARSAHG